MTIHLPKAVLFDLDNTILANDASAPKHWGQAFERFASRLGGLDTKQLLAAMTDVRGSTWATRSGTRGHVST